MVSEKEIIQAVKRIRDTAMEQTLAARIPECGEFGAIAQDADWLFDVLTAAARVRAEDNAGEPVAWGEDIDGKIVSVRLDKSRHCTVPLYPAPQPSGPVKELDEDDYEEIISAAAINMRKATSGIRGQVVTVQDSLEWWVMKETERRILSALTAGKPEQHPDDEAVDCFAAAMKAKLKWEREERGRYGWNDPEVCSEEYLAKLLIEHLAKGNEGNFEDVANFCMMLHQRGAHPRVLAAAFATAGKPSGTVEALKRIAQLKEVRRGGGAFDYEPALSAMEMYEIAFDALSALTAGKPEQSA